MYHRKLHFLNKKRFKNGDGPHGPHQHMNFFPQNTTSYIGMSKYLKKNPCASECHWRYLSINLAKNCGFEAWFLDNRKKQSIVFHYFGKTVPIFSWNGEMRLFIACMWTIFAFKVAISFFGANFGQLWGPTSKERKELLQKILTCVYFHYFEQNIQK